MELSKLEKEESLGSSRIDFNKICQVIGHSTKILCVKKEGTEMKKRMFKVALTLMAILLVPALLDARIFYVSPGGSGTECTQANPCALQTALDAAGSNNEDDTVNLLTGTYEGNFKYVPQDTEHKSIAIKGAEGTTPEQVILDGQNTGTVLYMHDWSSGDLAEVLIEGLTLRNGRADSRSAGGLHAVLAHYDITVSHCVIHDNVGNGSGGGGIVDSHYAVVFENNVVYRNSVNEYQYAFGYASRGGGVGIIGEPAYVRNNLIYGNRANGEHCSPWGGGLWTRGSGDGCFLINNTIVQNEASQGGGIYLENGLHHFYNNIIYQNDAAEGADIYIGSYASGVAYYNDYTGLYGSWSEDGGNIAVDPRFVSSDLEDYHLSRQSPCINTGTNNVPDPPGLPTTDFEGDQRIIDGTVDMGADEYTPQEGGPSSQNIAATKGIAVVRMKDDGTIYLYVPSLLVSDSEGNYSSFELLFKLEDLKSITFRLEDARALSSTSGPISAFFNPGQGLLYISYVVLIDTKKSTTIFKNFTFSVGSDGNEVFIALRDYLGDRGPTITEYIGGTKEVGSGVPKDVAQRYLDMMTYIENLLKGTSFTTPQTPAPSSTFNWDIQDW